MTSAVQDYLGGTGAPLLEFERVTASLVTGAVPEQSTCRHYFETVLPGAVPGPKALLRIAAEVPDRALATDFTNDIASKNLLLLACRGTSETVPGRAVQVVIDRNRTLMDRLAAYDRGI